MHPVASVVMNMALRLPERKIGPWSSIFLKSRILEENIRQCRLKKLFKTADSHFDITSILKKLYVLVLQGFIYNVLTL